MRELLELAKSKRSSSLPDVWTPKDKTLREIAKIPPPVAEGGYCSKCHYPLKFIGNKPLDCENCKATTLRDEEQTKIFVEKMGGWKAWNQYTRETYIRTKFNADAMDAALAFNGKDSLLIWGPPGTGKTHLAAIAKRPLIRAGLDVHTVRVVEMLAEVKSRIKESQVLQQAVQRCLQAKILSVEDMAVEKPSEFVVEFYYRVIDGRDVAGKPGMIVTCNMNLGELDTYWYKFDPHKRISSRLKQMCKIVNLKGEKDWRAERQS